MISVYDRSSIRGRGECLGQLYDRYDNACLASAEAGNWLFPIPDGQSHSPQALHQDPTVQDHGRNPSNSIKAHESTEVSVQSELAEMQRIAKWLPLS